MLEPPDRYSHPSALGPRICIVGPGGAGKSMLAAAIGRKLGTAPVYVDLLLHQPFSRWRPRPWDEYVGLHAEAVAAHTWLLDGNYLLIGERLARATGVIWLDMSRWRCLFNYARRTLPGGQRVGRLPGAGPPRFSRRMLRQILFDDPAERPKRHAELSALAAPVLRLASMQELKALYRRWGLEHEDRGD